MGRPKSTEFRARCRAATEAVLASVEEDIRLKKLDKLPLWLRLQALEILGDRGGYLTADREMGTLLKVLALQNLSEDQRTKLVDSWMKITAPEPEPVDA